MSLGRLQQPGGGFYSGFTGKPPVTTIRNSPMQPLRRNVNPFALMIDPQAVLAQIESSERLEGLHRRVCRPLDKPLLGGNQDGSEDLGDGDNPAAEDGHAK